MTGYSDLNTQLFPLPQYKLHITFSFLYKVDWLSDCRQNFLSSNYHLFRNKETEFIFPVSYRDEVSVSVWHRSLQWWCSRAIQTILKMGFSTVGYIFHSKVSLKKLRIHNTASKILPRENKSPSWYKKKKYFRKQILRCSELQSSWVYLHLELILLPILIYWFSIHSPWTPSLSLMECWKDFYIPNWLHNRKLIMFCIKIYVNFKCPHSLF